MAAVLGTVAVLALTENDAEPPSSARGEPTAAREVTLVPTTAPQVLGAPSATVLPDRNDCDEIRGTQYLSTTERAWFLANCTKEAAPSRAPGDAVGSDAPPEGSPSPERERSPGPTSQFIPPPGPPATPSPTLQPGEAKSIAIDWLVDQGAEWLSSAILHLPNGMLDFRAYQMDTSRCIMAWGEGRWTASCPVRTYVEPGQSTFYGVAHLWVYEGTRAVGWADSPVT